MTVRIDVIFYKGKRNLDRVLDKFQRSDFVKLYVVTSKANAARLNKALWNELRHDFESELKVRNDKWALDFISPEDDADLIRQLGITHSKEVKILGEDVIFDFDVTAAVPWEAVAVARFSAAVESRIHMDRDGGGTREIKSFPRILHLDEHELEVLDFMSDRSHFNTMDLMTEMGMNRSRAYKTMKSLTDKNCLEDCSDEKRDRGIPSSGRGRSTGYYSVRDETWFMERVNRRKIESLPETEEQPKGGTEETAEGENGDAS